MRAPGGDVKSIVVLAALAALLAAPLAVLGRKHHLEVRVSVGEGHPVTCSWSGSNCLMAN